MPDSRNNRPLWIVLSGLAALLFFSLCGLLLVGVFFLIPSSGGESAEQLESETAAQVTSAVQPAATAAATQPLVIPADVEDYETAVLTAIYQQVSPSVVNVDVLSLGENVSQGQFLFPAPDDENAPDLPAIPNLQIDPESLIPQGQGSGFVWDREGHIVTNAHVVEGADQVQVKFVDGTVSVAEVVGLDEHSDLAVLKIDPAGYTLVPVARGNLDDVLVGERVAVIGNPFGFEGTLTSGIVSAIGRSIPALTSFNIPEAIQTDAVINPGNSGGPLLNEQGEVIGVNAQIRVSDLSNTGIGFAIPITIVERVIPALITDGAYEHSYIGISGNTFSPICADDLELSATLRGAYVVDVLSSTPAARAGLRGGAESSDTSLLGVCPAQKGGDLILMINDQPVSRFDDLLIYLQRYTSPGDTVVLTVLRDGSERHIDVTLAPRPTQR